MAKKSSNGNGRGGKSAKPVKDDKSGKSAANDEEVKGMMADMETVAREKKPSPVKKSKDRPVIRCETPEEAGILDRFTSADAELKRVSSSQKLAKADALEVFCARYYRMCIEAGYRPDNPEIVSNRSKVTFSVKHIKKIRRADDAPSISEQLRQLDLPEEVVSRVQEKAVHETVTVGLRNLTELTSDKATTDETELAKRLIKLIKKNFTPDEQHQLIEKHRDLVLDDGWQELAVSIAVGLAGDDVEKGVELLDKLYSALPPQFAFSGFTIFPGNNAPRVFENEAGQVAVSEKETGVPEKETGVSEKETIIMDGKGKYRARVFGKLMILFSVRPDGNEEEIGRRECKSRGHAESTAKKLFRDPEYLAEFLVNRPK